MKLLGKIIFLIFCLGVFNAHAVFCFAQSMPSFKVGLAVLKDNVDYAQARTAFKKFFEKQSDISIQFYVLDAHGHLREYEEGLQDLVENKEVDLIFTTGTPSTLPAIQWSEHVPLVFTAVAAPVETGIVHSLGKRVENITGTHCAVSADVQVRIILKVLPFARTLGIVYTENEPNAEIQLQNFQAAASAFNLRVKAAPISQNCQSEEGVAKATETIIDKIDILVALQDTSVSRYGKGMIDVANQFNVPVYATLTHLLDKGAFLSLGSNFYNIGFLAGEKAFQILSEEVHPASIPIETDLKYLLAVNLKSAERLNMTIPVQILRLATYILD